MRERKELVRWNFFRTSTNRFKEGTYKSHVLSHVSKTDEPISLLMEFQRTLTSKVDGEPVARRAYGSPVAGDRGRGSGERVGGFLLGSGGVRPVDGGVWLEGHGCLGGQAKSPRETSWDRASSYRLGLAS